MSLTKKIKKNVFNGKLVKLYNRLNRQYTTELPADLRAGVERLSGISMEDVKVYYNSPKPAQIDALAYAQGREIHIALGQEKHLPHEAWHVVQQAQGRVQPTMHLKNGMVVNDDGGLEQEAGMMGVILRQPSNQQFRFGSDIKQTKTTHRPKEKQCKNAIPIAQLCNDKVGLNPPKTFGRDTLFKSPVKPENTKLQRNVVPRGYLTRFERMIDRIGRILASEQNIHVAVALDDKALVLSANKEDQEYSLTDNVTLLKTVPNPNNDLSTRWRWRVKNEKRREVDIKKLAILLKGDYTDNEGLELYKDVREQLVRIKTAIEKGVIGKAAYLNGDAGMYVITTPFEKWNKEWNMHGELKVAAAIVMRRDLTKPVSVEDVYIGGTLIDCFSCNVSHWLLNQRLQQKGWQIYTGGTSGEVFPGYRINHISSDDSNFKDFTGSEIRKDSYGIWTANPYITDIRNNCNADDSDSDADDYAEIHRGIKLLEGRAKAKLMMGDLNNELKKIHDEIDGLNKEIKRDSFEKVKTKDRSKSVGQSPSNVSELKIVNEQILNRMTKIEATNLSKNNLTKKENDRISKQAELSRCLKDRNDNLTLLNTISKEKVNRLDFLNKRVFLEDK